MAPRAQAAAAPAGVSKKKRVAKKRPAKAKTREAKKASNKKRAGEHSEWRRTVTEIKDRVLKKINADNEKKNGLGDDVKPVKEWLRIEAHINELEAKVKELEEQVREKDQLIETIAFEVEKRDEEIDALKAGRQ